METKPYADVEVIDIDSSDESLPETTIQAREVKTEPDREWGGVWAPAPPETVPGRNNLVHHHKTEQPETKINLYEPEQGQIDQLIRRIAWHTGERPYKCPECSFRTLLRANMRKHVLVHRRRVKLDPDLVELRCNDCAYRTRVKRNLCRHVKRHGGLLGVKRLKTCREESRVKRYRCDLCKSRYLRKASLVEHLKRRPCSGQGVQVIKEAVIL